MEIPQDLIDLLLEKKKELEERLDRLKNSVRPLDKSSKEAAIELETKEVDEGLDKEAREELLLVYNAFERIKAGTYGACGLCHEDIPIKRLLAVPFTTHCIDCMADLKAS